MEIPGKRLSHQPKMYVCVLASPNFHSIWPLKTEIYTNENQLFGKTYFGHMPVFLYHIRKCRPDKLLAGSGLRSSWVDHAYIKLHGSANRFWTFERTFKARKSNEELGQDHFRIIIPCYNINVCDRRTWFGSLSLVTWFSLEYLSAGNHSDRFRPIGISDCPKTEQVLLKHSQNSGWQGACCLWDRLIQISKAPCLPGLHYSITGISTTIRIFVEHHSDFHIDYSNDNKDKPGGSNIKKWIERLSWICRENPA